MQLTTASAKKLLEQTRKNNKLLTTLPKAKARVIIAKDALAQIKLKQLVPTFGYYADWFDTNMDVLDVTAKGNPLIETEPCHVCGLGSLFIADYKIRNGKVRNGDSAQAVMRKRLNSFFDTKQLALIEEYFESRSNSLVTYAATKRLTFILNNIIENKGTFVPPKLWVSQKPWSLHHLGLDKNGNPNVYENEK